MQVISPTTPKLDPSSMRAELGLSRERMARLFDVSAKTIERWELRGSPPPATTDRGKLLLVRQIIDLGRIVYGEEGFRLFLSSPSPRFQGASPLQLIERGEGAQVLDTLAADYEGLGA